MGIKGNQNMSPQIMLLLHGKKFSLLSSLLLKVRCRFSFIYYLNFISLNDIHLLQIQHRSF